MSEPVKSALSGWWLEHYLFYVKHRDLGDAQTLVNMMLDPSVKAPKFGRGRPETVHVGWSAALCCAVSRGGRHYVVS